MAACRRSSDCKGCWQLSIGTVSCTGRSFNARRPGNTSPTLLTTPEEEMVDVGVAERRRREAMVVCGEKMSAGITMYDLETGEELMRLPTCASPPHGLLCLADHHLVASQLQGHRSYRGGAIFFWALNKVWPWPWPWFLRYRRVESLFPPQSMEAKGEESRHLLLHHLIPLCSLLFGSQKPSVLCVCVWLFSFLSDP